MGRGLARRDVALLEVLPNSWSRGILQLGVFFEFVPTWDGEPQVQLTLYLKIY